MVFGKEQKLMKLLITIYMISKMFIPFFIKSFDLLFKVGYMGVHY